MSFFWKSLKSLKDIPSILINKISKVEFDFKKIIPDFKKESDKKEKVKIIEDDSFLENINAEESIESLNQLVEKETFNEPVQETEKDITANKPKVGEDQKIDQNEISFEKFNLSQSLNLEISIIATNEVFYSNKDMYEAHDALICIKNKTYVNEKNRIKYSNQHYLKDILRCWNYFLIYLKR